ncbi:MAG: hypothetical protein QM820_51335 [Minicystis sp.]
MSKPPRSPDAEQASRLFMMLTDADPAGAKARAEHAARHRERTRRRPASPAAKPIEPPPDLEASLRTERRRASTPRPAPQREPTSPTYVHQGPTRSAVLNAFIHSFHGFGLVAESVAVPDEHLLGARLVEIARRYWSLSLRLGGEEELGREISRQTVPIENERAARFLMARALDVPGELGVIARDYQEHRVRAGSPEQDDWAAQCMMATFAGRLLQYAASKIGSHVRDDVGRELQRLTTKAAPPARQGAVRRSVMPEGSSDQRGRQVAETRRRRS